MIDRHKLQPSDLPKAQHFAAWLNIIGNSAVGRPLSEGAWSFLGPFDYFRHRRSEFISAHVDAHEYRRPALDPEFHSARVVVFIALEGEVLLQYGQSSLVKVDSQQLCISRTDMELRLVAPRAARFAVIRFDPAVLLLSSIFDTSRPAISLETPQRIRELLLGLIADLRVVIGEPDELAPRILFQVLAAAVDQLARGQLLALSKVDSGLMASITAYVDEQLREPGLDVNRICRHFGMSRATLYRQLQYVGGVKRFILIRRLSQCFDALVGCDDQEERNQIARNYSFRAYGDFSARYRKLFDINPVKLLEREPMLAREVGQSRMPGARK